ncbi:hypothetical protein SteCoe_19632 [Stentor coeruleus]|uniref:EF-hand domain-containing protein n=1 Tax=Stentor coeruleus TaxID=5963 RepID=A0A1R2BTN1_9CILI|nr:hypothetical protein SteCoe_19632 [Stentor coeruleus]
MGNSNAKSKQLIFSLLEERNQAQQALKELQGKIVQQQSEIKRLKDLASKYKGLKNRKIKRLKSDLDVLLQEIDSHKRWKSYQIVKTLFKKYREIFHCTLEWGFNKWKYIQKDHNLKTIDTNMQAEEEILFKDLDISEAKSWDKNLTQKIWKQNMLIQIYAKSRDAPERNLQIKQLIRLFEEVLLNKYMKDNLDIQDNRKPLTFPEYFLVFLQQKHNSLPQVTKSIQQIFQSLDISKETSQYLALFSKFLQMEKTEPIDNFLSLYLTKSAFEFTKLIKTKDEKTGRDLNVNNKKIMKASEGGNAYIKDVFSLINQKFPRKKLHSIIITLLRPPHISKEDYLLFQICYELQRLGISSEQLFDYVDIEKRNFVSVVNLMQGIEDYLMISIVPENSLVFLNAINCINNDYITKANFLSKVCIKVYENSQESPRYTISKCMFLQVLLEVYMKIRIKSICYYLEVFDAQRVRVLRFDEFQKIVRVIDSECTEDMIEYLFREGLGMQLDTVGLNKESFVKVLIDNGIGDKGLKYFCAYGQLRWESTPPVDFGDLDLKSISADDSLNSSINTSDEYMIFTS